MMIQHWEKAFLDGITLSKKSELVETFNCGFASFEKWLDEVTASFESKLKLEFLRDSGA